MRFKPSTKEELAMINLLPEDSYQYEVIESVEKLSKSGNEMIALKLRVYYQDKAHIVFDYLLEALAFKLIHFCEYNGLMDKYESGNLTSEDCMGKKGYAEISIAPQNGNYAAQNKVKDYLCDMPKELETPTEFNDPIPF